MVHGTKYGQSIDITGATLRYEGLAAASTSPTPTPKLSAFLKSNRSTGYILEYSADGMVRMPAYLGKWSYHRQ